MDPKLAKLIAFKNKREAEREAELQKIYSRLKDAPEAVRERAFARDENLKLIWDELSRRDPDKTNPVNTGDKPSVYDARPAWDVKFDAEPEQNPTRSAKQQIIRKRKIRNKNIVISISEEEKNIISVYTKKKGLSLSNWVRKLIFDAMGVPIPARPSD